ncbi:hypothetical protein ABT158_19290 [Nonomuraea sp. NPDC001636]|uniref:hypothetical protein n=1 Tax=Nonomuraea sp. NPDC001636 TaxID=3154391 RepID=UPI0033204923
MDHDAVLALFDRQMRREARPDGPDVRVERDAGVVRQVGPPHAWNGVLWSGLDEESADAAVARQVRFFGDLGLGFEWKLYAHDRPADLADRLLAAGFAAEPAETVMVARVADLDTEVEPPDGVSLVPVTDEAGVRALVAWRARWAAARGYDYLQVDASDQSRPILLGLGFVPLTTTTPYVRA